MQVKLKSPPPLSDNQIVCSCLPSKRAQRQSETVSGQGQGHNSVYECLQLTCKKQFFC